MDFKKLNEYLSQQTDINVDKMKNYTIKNAGHSFEETYLILIALGDVIHMDENNKRYAGRIKSGFMKSNIASYAISYKENQIDVAIYAKEGIISQHTDERIIDELKRNFS